MSSRGRDGEDAGRAIEFDVDGRPKDLLVVEEGKIAGEASVAEGVGNARLEDAFGAVFELQSFVADVGDLICDERNWPTVGVEALAVERVDRCGEVKIALEGLVGFVAGLGAAGDEIADGSKPAIEDGFKLKFDQAESILSDGVVDGGGEGRG